MKALILAGGTGGHVYPALSVAKELNTGKLIICGTCNQPRPKEYFLDPSLKSGVGRKCKICKKVFIKRESYFNSNVQIFTIVIILLLIIILLI